MKRITGEREYRENCPAWGRQRWYPERGLKSQVREEERSLEYRMRIRGAEGTKMNWPMAE